MQNSIIELASGNFAPEVLSTFARQAGWVWLGLLGVLALLFVWSELVQGVADRLAGGARTAVYFLAFVLTLVALPAAGLLLAARLGFSA